MKNAKIFNILRYIFGVFLIIGGLLFHKTGENEYLKREQDMNRKILDAQANYYTLLLEKNKEIRAFRHDIKIGKTGTIWGTAGIS